MAKDYSGRRSVERAVDGDMVADQYLPTTQKKCMRYAPILFATPEPPARHSSRAPSDRPHTSQTRSCRHVTVAEITADHRGIRMHDGKTRQVEIQESEVKESFLDRHQASITILRGPAAGTEYALDRKRAILGRSPDADIQIHDPSISTEHAAIELDADGFGIRDLASTNGVRINGANVLASALKHGDRIQLGECEVQYILEERARQARTWSVDEDA